MGSIGDVRPKGTVRDQVVAALRVLIEQKQGDKPVRIEAERALSERLSVSRISLRSAVESLVDEGLLVRKRGSGTYIVPSARPAMVHLIAAQDIKPQDPFYSEFLAEFSRYLGEQSIHLRVLHPERLPSRPTNAPLIVVGLVDPALMRSVLETHSMVVATQSYPDSMDFSQICFDDYRIGSEAASVLVHSGHRRLVHLAGPDHFASARQRRRGFLDRAQALGAEVETIEGKMNWAAGYDLADRVTAISRGGKPVTALFAANDWMALGVMQRMRENGVRIPETLSVIGCDDIHLASEAKPHLSTFRWDMVYLIRELFAHLRSMSASADVRHRRILLPAQFVNRESFAEISVGRE